MHLSTPLSTHQPFQQLTPQRQVINLATSPYKALQGASWHLPACCSLLQWDAYLPATATYTKCQYEYVVRTRKTLCWVAAQEFNFNLTTHTFNCTSKHTAWTWIWKTQRFNCIAKRTAVASTRTGNKCRWLLSTPATPWHATPLHATQKLTCRAQAVAIASLGEAPC